MAHVIPFKGILPQKQYAGKIVTLSADNYTIEQVKKIIQHNELSYLSVIYPDLIDGKKTEPHSLERFQKIYNRFQWLKNKSYFVQDSQPSYYIYKQQHKEFEFNGIIAAISTEDYFNGVIKIHEQTLSEREKKLKEYLKYCKINAEPVLFFYPDNEKLNNTIESIQSASPYLEVSVNEVKHFLWKTDAYLNETIKAYFDEIAYVFIADGHHRSAASSLLSKELSTNPNAQYFLAAFFPENNLKIFSFHRLINEVTVPDDFLEKISSHFYLEKIDANKYTLAKHIIGMYWNGNRYLLKYKHNNDESLDTDILYKYILKDIFKLEDVRNNSSIHYFSEYTCSKNEAEQMVNKGEYQMAFFTHPVTTQDIKNIALQNQIMPPKSTYILPKLLNAFVIYSLDNGVY